MSNGNNPHNLKPGDSLYYRTSYGDNRSQTLRITKIGREWAQVDGWRFRVNLKTLRADTPNYGYSGQCWLTEQHWLDERARERALDDFKVAVARMYTRDGVTLEQINEARRVLGIEEKEAAK